MKFVNPKISPGADPVDEWYRYYAGYSASFVNHTLSGVVPNANSILDPWNGTGTTTVVAANKKIKATGFDINPSMTIVSRARLLDRGVSASIKALADDIVSHSNSLEIKDEPLCFWFIKSSAATIRGLQGSVHRLLVNSSTNAYPAIETVRELSTLAAFFYTAMFRTVRLLIEPVAGTNPTWWSRIDPKKRLRPSRDKIVDFFLRSAVELCEGLHRTNFDLGVDTIIDIGNSRDLPISDNSIDVVISSPPYCTRIDYGISTRPELAILGASEDELKNLRDLMVGTPTITNDIGLDLIWGDLANSFLSKVERHESKASHSYYLKYYRQYYHGMWKSIAELRRVIMDGGAAFLVVQDNYYKEIHNDSPAILMEMATLNGFSSTERFDFQVTRNMNNMNPKSKKYRKSGRNQAVESVIIFQ